MKRILFSIAFVLAVSVSFAQTGNNAAGVGVDVFLPIRYLGEAYGVGAGGHVKGLYGVGTAGQVTFTIGYASFKGKSGLYEDQKYSFMPFLLGYRHHFTNLFVEPQLGINTSKTKYKGDVVDKITSFSYAINGGYTKGGFEVSLGLQNAGLTGHIALRGGVAYNVPLAGKKK